MDSYITLRFIRTRGFVTTAICWVTNSLMSHVEFGTPDGTWIGAHSDGGVRERAGDYCQPSEEWRYQIPCTQAQADELIKNARAAIGIPYNFADIAGLLLHLRRLTKSDRLICSQFCFLQLNAVGIKMLNVLPQFGHLITPETLHLSPVLIGRKVRPVAVLQ